MRTKISILIPVFNEADLIGTVSARVLAVSFGNDVETEIVAVDDGSTDGSAEVLDELCLRHHKGMTVVKHNHNRGKGAAIRTALEFATGEFAVVQDSDLEYNPQDLPSVFRPLLEGRADAVFGSRFLVSGERRVLYFWHSLANGLLTTICNAVADLNLSDMETGYKAFRVSLVRSIPLRSERFGFEPELTIKLAQRGAALYEVPISYRGRTYAEGKKIGLKDAIEALWVITQFGFRRDIYLDRGARILDALAQTPRFNRWMADCVLAFIGQRVVEIGAGIGNLSQHLSSKRQSYAATDIDAEHLARLKIRFQNRPNISFRRCDLSAPRDFEDLAGQADTVVCLNVLEHIADDIVGLRNIASVLIPGGRAIVLVPQGQSIYGSLDRVLGHFRRYSEAELRSKMEAAGLEIEHVLKFNRVTRPGWYLNGRVLRRKYFSRFQLWCFDHLVWLWKRIDTTLPWGPVSVIVVARKPAADASKSSMTETTLPQAGGTGSRQSGASLPQEHG